MVKIADRIRIAADDKMPAVPSKDAVHRCLTDPTVPATPHTTLAVGRMLARMAWEEGRIDVAEERVVEQLRALWGPALAVVPLGMPVAHCDASGLGVSAAIDVLQGVAEPLAQYPVYVVRSHDHALAKVLEEVEEGASRIAVLYGDSATGKTRACWEAVRALGPKWRLWQPSADAGVDVEHVGPHTVIWLDEMHRHLLTPGTADGERLADALRSLLADTERSPVLVVGTTWLEEWELLTGEGEARKESPRARALLSGTGIHVSPSFGSDGDWHGLREAATGDPRLAQAVEMAEGRHVIQYLAGGPVQLERCRSASDGARAVIETAMDARRLGFASALPRSLFEGAAHGYLTDQQWEALPEGWLDQGLEWASERLRGIPGPLTRIRPRPDAPGLSEPHYRMADFIAQHGRTTRGTEQVPVTLWNALTAHVTDRNDIGRLVESARSRSHFGYLVQLRLQQVEAGDDSGLADLWMTLDRAGEGELADEILLNEAAEGGAQACLLLAEQAEWAEASLDREMWLREAVHSGSSEARIELAELLAERSGDNPESQKLIAEVEAAAPNDDKAAAALADLGRHPESLFRASHLARLRQAADAGDAAAARRLRYALQDEERSLPELEQRLAQMAREGDSDALLHLVEVLERQGRYDEARAVLEEAIQRGTPTAETPFIKLLQTTGATAEIVTTAAEDAQARLRPGISERDPQADTELLKLLILMGRHDEIDQFLATRPARLEQSMVWSQLLEKTGLEAQRIALLWQCFELGDSKTALPLFYHLRASEQTVEPLTVNLRHRADAGDLWALCMLTFVACYTEAEDAEALMRRSISCGAPMSKILLLTLLHQTGRDPERIQLLRYGLAPDGSTADPFP
ncbi:tetratricopeptide repeat protein [Streptomyces sp. NPDC056949]|uniref:tetratricopeptide repeat protein n=1 Tax=Streptomyces sp. NPDC056949 TaxID=3345976 RepID=UPI0036392B0D